VSCVSEKESILVFLSYSSKDKDLAGEIKRCLEEFGVEVFLAHEDIRPTEKWKKVILDHLHRCDIFVPIVTKNFKESDWTDQETGIALGKNKMIIPIGRDIMPYGFLEDDQAITVNDVSRLCNQVCELIKGAFSNPYISILIQGIEESETFNVTNGYIDRLSESGNLTIGQIERLLEAFISNTQVSGAWRARSFIRKLLEDGLEITDQTLETKVRALLE